MQRVFAVIQFSHVSGTENGRVNGLVLVSGEQEQTPVLAQTVDEENLHFGIVLHFVHDDQIKRGKGIPVALQQGTRQVVFVEQMIIFQIRLVFLRKRIDKLAVTGFQRGVLLFEFQILVAGQQGRDVGETAIIL